MQDVLGAARGRRLDDDDDGSVSVGGHSLIGDEFEIALEPATDGAVGSLSGGDAVVVLDTELTAALINEGHARQLSRHIQDARKSSGFEVTDRIALVIDTDDEVQQWLAPHLDHLASQVLATKLDFASVESEFTYELDGHPVSFTLVVTNA